LPFSATAMQRVRQGRGLTQEDLATILGCSVQAVRAWEQGDRRPTAVNQLLIAQKLRVDPVDLYERPAHEDAVAV
jgi:transcriptional regulator with XRE-family HTH domain